MKLPHYLISLGMLVFFNSAIAANLDCKLVLAKPSQAWITAASEKQGGSTPALVHAISQYANCMDKNAQELHAYMIKSGHYPLMGANGNFRDFTEALQSFTKLALKITATGGTWDNTQAAYTNLYQKQFTLLFYAPYLGKIKNPVLTRLQNTKRPDLNTTKAYYKKILSRFTPAQQAALNKEFNQLLSIATAENQFKEEYVYDYAIYILQPISDSLFSSPPF